MLRVTRVLAPNPSVFTLEGTNTWIAGEGPVVVIDPGPDDPAHLEEVASTATATGPVAAVAVTHDHPDHAPGAVAFAAMVGAPLFAFRLAGAEHVRDGQRLPVPGMDIVAIHTPGHTSDHVAFHVPRDRALFTGDAVLGRGTSFIDPPDGDLAQYLRSLAVMQDLKPRTIYPGHGPVVLDAGRTLQEYVDHRAEREAQVVAAVAGDGATVKAMVATIYADYPAEVHELAARSVLAHLLKLESEGRVQKRGRGQGPRVVGGRAAFVRTMRQAGQGPRSLLPHVQPGDPAGGFDRRAGRLSRRASSGSRHGKQRGDQEAPSPHDQDAAVVTEGPQRSVRRFTRCTAQRRQVLLGEREAHQRAARSRASESPRQVLEAQGHTIGDVEPCQLVGEIGESLATTVHEPPGTVGCHRSEPDGAERSHVGGGGRTVRPADGVARSQDVESQHPAVVVDRRFQQGAVHHDGHPRTGLALPHDDPARRNGQVVFDGADAASRGGCHDTVSLPGEVRWSANHIRRRRHAPSRRCDAASSPAATRARLWTSGPTEERTHRGGIMAKPKLDNVLAGVPLFEGLSKRHLKKLGSLAEMADFMEGASVVKEGQPGESFFVAITGQAKVTVKGRTVHRILPGDHFGEISLIDGGDRTATVVTETPMTLLMIDRKPFLKMLADDPDVAVSLLEGLARMIRRVDRSLAR